MHYEKKQIVKEDGRYLVYYHFATTATAEQTSVFEKAEELAKDPLFTHSSGDAAPSGTPDRQEKKDDPVV